MRLLLKRHAGSEAAESRCQLALWAWGPCLPRALAIETWEERCAGGWSAVAVLRSQRMWLQNIQEASDDFMSMPGEPTNFTKFSDFMSALPGLRVIMDCTPSEEPADLYEKWLAAGINVVTANKKAGSGSLKRYKAITEAARLGQSQFLYEATVGAGLPVLTTLQDMVRSGDDVHVVEGRRVSLLPSLRACTDRAEQIQPRVAE